MSQEELNSEMLEAAEKGDTDKIWELIEQGADINSARDKDGWTALIWSAYNGSLTPELLEALVSMGADVNASNKYGETALMWSARNSYLTPELLEAFISHGADMNARDKDGWTAMMKSALRGYLTPELLEALVSRGADVNARNKDGETALMLSAYNGSLTPELLEALVSMGADVNASNKYGETALMWSARNSYLTPELLEAFMSHGADINTLDDWNRTALMESARNGHLTPELLEAFMKNGADVNARDKWGKTAMMWSAECGHLTPELLETFISHGANINARDKNDTTVLIYSAYNGCLTPELLEAFMKNGADVNAHDKDGNSAMSLCLKGWDVSGMVRSILSFLSCGYSIRNMYDGWTPENFIERLSGNAGINAEQRAAFAMLASLSMYPERNETLDKYVSKKRSAAADLIIPYLQDVSPDIRENFLRMMSEGRAGALSLSEKNIAVLVKMLIEAMYTNPGLAAEFIRKRVGKKVETWVKDGVEGADALVSRLAHHMRQEEFMSEGAGMPDLDLF